MLGAKKEQILAKMAAINWEEEIDTQEVLQHAAARKHWHLEEMREKEERRLQALEAHRKLKEAWSAERFIRTINDHYRAKHGDVHYHLDQTAYFRALSFWITGDERLETEMRMSRDKGLLILGGPGQGKTETLKAIRTNELRPLAIYSMLEITDRVRETGDCQIRTNRATVLDDVGSEVTPVKYYGTEIYWFKDFIETIYLQEPERKRNLIITTNLDGEALQALYGYRVRSRLREMFNIIKLNGKDHRK